MIPTLVKKGLWNSTWSWLLRVEETGICVMVCASGKSVALCANWAMHDNTGSRSTTIKINCCSSSLKNFYPTVYHQLQKNHSFSTKKCPYTDSDRPQRMVLYPRDRFRSCCSYKLTLDSFKCIALVTVLQQLLQRTWFILLPQVDLKLLKNTILTGFTHIIFNLYCTKYLRSHWPDLKIEAY